VCVSHTASHPSQSESLVQDWTQFPSTHSCPGGQSESAQQSVGQGVVMAGVVTVVGAGVVHAVVGTLVVVGLSVGLAVV